MFNKMFGGCGCGRDDYDKCNGGSGFDCCWIIVWMCEL